MAFFSAALLLTLIRFIKLNQLQSKVVYLKQASVDKIAYCYRSYEILLCLSAAVGARIGCLQFFLPHMKLNT